MAKSSDSDVPTRDQLGSLAARLEDEYEPRFTVADMDLAIGRAGTFISRGISVEIAEDWNWFKAARWSLFKRRWVVTRALTELESTVRDFLETRLTSRPKQ